MARRPLAKHDQVFPDRLQAELRIKCSDAHDLGGLYTCALRDIPNHILRQIAIDLLCVLQNRDEAPGDIGVCIQNAVQKREIAFLGLTSTIHSRFLQHFQIGFRA